MDSEHKYWVSITRSNTRLLTLCASLILSVFRVPLLIAHALSASSCRYGDIIVTDERERESEDEVEGKDREDESEKEDASEKEDESEEDDKDGEEEKEATGNSGGNAGVVAAATAAAKASENAAEVERNKTTPHLITGTSKEGDENDGESKGGDKDSNDDKDDDVEDDEGEDDDDENGGEDNGGDEDEEGEEEDHVDVFVSQKGKGATLKLRVRWVGWGPKDDTWELRSRLVEDLGEKTVSCHEIKMRVEEEKKATMKRARDEQSRENNYRKVYTSAPGDSSKRQRAAIQKGQSPKGTGGEGGGMVT